MGVLSFIKAFFNFLFKPFANKGVKEWDNKIAKVIYKNVDRNISQLISQIHQAINNDVNLINDKSVKNAVFGFVNLMYGSIEIAVSNESLMKSYLKVIIILMLKLKCDFNNKVTESERDVFDLIASIDDKHLNAFIKRVENVRLKIKSVYENTNSDFNSISDKERVIFSNILNYINELIGEINYLIDAKINFYSLQIEGLEDLKKLFDEGNEVINSLSKEEIDSIKQKINRVLDLKKNVFNHVKEQGSFNSSINLIELNVSIHKLFSNLVEEFELEIKADTASNDLIALLLSKRELVRFIPHSFQFLNRKSREWFSNYNVFLVNIIDKVNKIDEFSNNISIKELYSGKETYLKSIDKKNKLREQLKKSLNNLKRSFDSNHDKINVVTGLVNYFRNRTKEVVKVVNKGVVSWVDRNK